MSIQSQIDRIKSNLSAAYDALAEKGVEVGGGSDRLAEMVSSITTGNEIEEGDVTFVNNVTSYEFTNRQDKDVLMFFCFLTPATIEDGTNISLIDPILYNQAKGIWMYFQTNKNIKYDKYSYSSYCIINGYIRGTMKYYASSVHSSSASVAKGGNIGINSYLLAGRTYHYVIIYDN